MIFDKKILFPFLLCLGILVNILLLTQVNILYTTTLLSFCIYTLLPGFLISLILRLRKISFWENLACIIGFSIAFLEFGGLFLNILLPLLGIKNPLAFQNVVIGFDGSTLLLFLFAWIRTKQLVVKIRLPRCSRIEKGLYILPVFFPVLATLGAIMLNNGGSNSLTLILLGAIACYCLLLVLSRDKIAANLYPYAIFFIAVASLFTTSLRSWYISGHDIEREFYVFQLTNTHHTWSMAFYQDAYNACLSITILPTILTNLLALQDIYIYKIIFQVLFAISPVIAFFILRKYTTPILAFLSAFFFMSFPTFFNDMPMLNRQEIGFIFFGLVLYMMLLSDLSLAMRKILFTIFALSIVVSHYSTNFVVLSLVALVYVLTVIISLPLVKKVFAASSSKSRFHTRLRDTFPHKAFLSLPLVLLLFFATYIWNDFYTHSSNHVGSVMEEVVNNIFVKSNADTKSSDVSYSIFSSSKADPQQQLQNYIQNILQSIEANHSGQRGMNQFYSKSITSSYPSYPIPQEQLAPTPLGSWLSSFHLPVFTIQAQLRSLSASFMQIFVGIGLLAVVFLKHKKTFDLQYLLLCFSALFLLILETILPAISAEYGLLRMFEQLLFILALPIVLGLNATLFFVHEQKRIFLIGIIAVIFFLDLTGFISHLTGDYYPQMTLDNAGLYYDAYYVRTVDVSAITWLSQNNINDEPVYSDLAGANKLLTYGGVNGMNEIFPALIQKNSYVFLEDSRYVVVSINSDVSIYNSPKEFLDKNKNHIYSNGQVNIYK